MKAMSWSIRCLKCGKKLTVMKSMVPGRPLAPHPLDIMQCDDPLCRGQLVVDSTKEVELEIGPDGHPRVRLAPGQISVPMGERAHVSATVIKKDGRRIELGVVASNDPAHPVQYHNPEKEG